MSEVKIDAALVTAYRAAMPALVSQTAYEGASFTPTNGTKWAALFNLRATADMVTLGEGGQDEHSGVFQIDINVPETDLSARATLLADADTLRAYFIAGRYFTYLSQNVLVRRCDVSSIRRVDGWLRISASVTYSARSTRPEV